MDESVERLAGVLVCPGSHASLEVSGDGLISPHEGRQFGRNAHGYFDFTDDASLQAFDTTTDDYADDQRRNKQRFFNEFLKPWLDREPAERVLEVGTGLGMEISFLIDEGRDAFGVDLPCLSPFWARNGNDPDRFFCCEGAALPFSDGYFDAVFSLGVIEHVGTAVGHYTLQDNYQAAREAFAAEVIRVTKPGGRMLITCPNKTFPIDLAHEPTDAATPPGTMRLRRFVYDKTGMTVHPPFGRYHLLSFGELRQLFCATGGARSITTAPAPGYFSFDRFGSGPFGAFRRLVAAYVSHLPEPLRATPLSPFLLAEIRK